MRVMPTEEEIKILREKFNSIKDIYPSSNKPTQKIKKNPEVKITEIESKRLKEAFGRLEKENKDLKTKLKENQSMIENLQKEKAEEHNNGNQRENLDKSLNDYLGINTQGTMGSKDIYSRTGQGLSANKNENKKSFAEQYQSYENQGFQSQNLNFLLKKLQKVQSDIINGEKQIKEQEKKIYSNEKQNEILDYLQEEDNLSNNDYMKILILTLLNRNSLDEQNKKILKQIFSFQNMPNNLGMLLLNRIENLEYQNFFLINKIDYYIKVIGQLSDEVIEHIEIIGDIKNVLSKENRSDQFSKDFYSIKNTLNQKMSILNNKKDSINDLKNEIAQNDITLKNQNIILCKDKFVELKNERNSSSSKVSKNENKIMEIINVRLNDLNSLKDILNKYEDFVGYLQNENDINTELENKFKIKDEICYFNELLKSNNSKLKYLLMEIVEKCNISDNTLNNKIMKILNEKEELTNLCGEDCYINFIGAQCKIMEYSLLSKN